MGFMAGPMYVKPAVNRVDAWAISPTRPGVKLGYLRVFQRGDLHREAIIAGCVVVLTARLPSAFHMLAIASDKALPIPTP
jgi:hypothetical protein